jgi:DNA (cytosine-5)-methyltransferase 1
VTRFYLQARNDGKEIIWPDPTHCKRKKLEKTKTFYPHVLPWAPARGCIDFGIPSKSIFRRKKALAEKTLIRTEQGILKHVSVFKEVFLAMVRHEMHVLTAAVEEAQHYPFLVILRNHADSQSIDDPMPTITASGTHVGLGEAFLIPNPLLIKYHGGTGTKANRSQSIDDPLATIDTANRFAIVEPSIINMKGQSTASSVDEPAPTQCTNGHLYLAEASYILPPRKFDRMDVDDLSEPLRTIDASTGHNFALIEPFLVQKFGERAGQVPRVISIGEPMPTVTTVGAGMLVEPFAVDMAHGQDPNQTKAASAERRVQSLDEPLGTITANPGNAVAECITKEAFLVDRGRGHKEGESGAARVHSIDEPLNTLTAAREKSAAECVIQYNGTSLSKDIDEPLPTIPTKDRFALVQVFIKEADGTMASHEYPWALVDDEGSIRYFLDVRLRMLKPRELQAAHSLKDYIFTGNVSDQIKQIGNGIARWTVQSQITAMFWEGTREALNVFLLDQFLTETNPTPPKECVA